MVPVVATCGQTMNTTIFVRRSAGDELKRDVRKHAERKLGRLQRFIRNAELLMEEQHVQDDDQILHAASGPDRSWRCAHSHQA